MQPGSAVGPYQILRHLGTGGMGSVWLAHDTRLNRQVALKTVRGSEQEDSEGRDHLMREARAAAALNHPHIAAVHDVLETDGQVVIVFEYVEGETLSSRLRRGSLPVDEAVALGCQMAEALAAAHAHGVVHRDLKPANVIVGAEGQLKVLDFGVARLLHTGTTVAPTSQTTSGPGFVGTAAYAAPEQMHSSAVDERADLYALGVVLYEMISGHRPFPSHDAAALAHSKRHTDAPALESSGRKVPRALDRLIASLLARDPRARPASADDALRQLQAIRDGVTLRMVAGIRPSKRSAVVVAAALALSVVVVSLMLWLRSRQAVASDSTTPPVVAVMPLANMSGDGSRDYVAAGISENLITSLASLPSVTVLSRAAVSDARARSVEPAALMKDLGATYLVEGSVQQSGERLKIALNLVRADRSIAWADSYEGLFGQIFELQTRMAGAASEALRVQVAGRDRARLANPPTSNPQALSAYWQGRALLERRDVKGNLDAAIRSFEEATRLDPRFALAHAALGESYWQQYSETRQPSWVQKAIDEGVTALRLGPEEPEVRYSVAVTFFGSGRLNDAVDELQRALALRSNYDDARGLLGQVLARQGKIDEAVAEFQKAIAIRPTFWGHYSTMGIRLLQAGRFQEAAESFRKVIELQPDNFLGFQQLGVVQQTLGQHDAALTSYAAAIARRPNAQAYSNVGAIHHLRGEYGDAVEAYRKALELRPNSHITHRNLGDALARMGRNREAHDEYRRAAEQAEQDLKIDPRDAGTMASLAVYWAKMGRTTEAVRQMEQARAAAAQDPQVLYRSGVVLALARRQGDAIEALTAAVARGYSRTVIAEDDDLSSLHQLSEFRALVNSQDQPGGKR